MAPTLSANVKQCFLLLLILTVVTGCQRRLVTTLTSTPITHATPDREAPIDPILIPQEYSHEVFNGLRHGDAVFKFYGHHDYTPFWLEKNVRSARADSMIVIIRSARRFGLLPQHYHFHEIPELVLHPTDRGKMARLDIILTDAFFSIAHDLKRGRIPRKGNTELDSTQTALLTDTLKPKDIKSTLASQEPPHKGYVALKGALNNLLDTVNLTDQNLLLYGITNDSIEVHRIAQRIEINLERWRNENESLANTYTWINIPAYMFYVIEDQSVVMESRVIVGAPATPTPQFSSKIECFTIFPYWFVPRKIAVEEYLPILKKDTSFITRNNFQVLDRSGNVQALSSIDWQKYTANNFPFTLRQREGTENSLGIIKFIFDNPYAVFLHDTNSKRLFRNTVRAYSHGCIRLEKAFEFSHYLIGGNRTKITSGTLDKYLHQQKRLTISLLQSVPIHIRYFTSEVREGKLLNYPDIYKKDGALIRALYHQSMF